MAHTNAQRVDESIQYIHNNISPELARKFAHIDKEAAGRQLSLEGYHYAPIGWDEQHRAVRALLLCHYQFLGGFALPDAAKKFFRSKSKADVNQYIKAYTREAPSLEALAGKAERFRVKEEAADWYSRHRDDNRLGGGSIICYTGVLLWLFQAGFVSLKWYRDNSGMNANNCNDILGAGVQVPIDDMDEIPRGYIWSFPGIRKEVCHWGISLGKGPDGRLRAVGTNNHTKEGTKSVAFEKDGGLKYGRFTLESQYEVSKIKYGSADIKDPSGQATDFVKVSGVETKLFKINPMLIDFVGDI